MCKLGWDTPKAQNGWRVHRTSTRPRGFSSTWRRRRLRLPREKRDLSEGTWAAPDSVGKSDTVRHFQTSAPEHTKERLRPLNTGRCGVRMSPALRTQFYWNVLGLL